MVQLLRKEGQFLEPSYQALRTDTEFQHRGTEAEILDPTGPKQGPKVYLTSVELPDSRYRDTDSPLNKAAE